MDYGIADRNLEQKLDRLGKRIQKLDELYNPEGLNLHFDKLV